MRRGTKHLRIASVIQIVLGAVSAAAIYLMIGTEGAAAGVDPQAALAALLLSYAGQALRVIAGLFGLLLSNKKSLFTVILGVLLFVPQLAAFLQVDGSIPLTPVTRPGTV